MLNLHVEVQGDICSVHFLAVFVGTGELLGYFGGETSVLLFEAFSE